MYFQLFAGSNHTSGSLQTSWGSYNATQWATGQVNVADSTSNNWLITGVQLEAGTTASDFEFLPVDVNLNRCYRYFYDLTEPGALSIALGSSYATNAYIYSYIAYPVTMRAVPTLTLTVASSTGTNSQGGYGKKGHIQFFGRGSGAVLDVYFSASLCTVSAEL